MLFVVCQLLLVNLKCLRSSLFLIPWLSVPLTANISFKGESGELPMSSRAQIRALPQVRAEPPMP